MTYTMPANRRIVLAATYRDFKRYVDHEADPRLLHEYAASDSALVGRAFTEDQLIYLPGWEAHPKADALINQVKVRLALNGRKR